MSHIAQQSFFEGIIEKYNDSHVNQSKVLEVGSLDINGSVRSLFKQTSYYLGIDLEDGNGVDIVSAGQDLAFPDNFFDCSVSSECFEHNPYWVETFLNMIRMTRNNGLIIMSCAGEGRPEHGTSRTSPWDSPFTVNAGWEYYKNLTPKDFYDAIDINSNFSHHEFIENNIQKDLYFYGLVKK